MNLPEIIRTPVRVLQNGAMDKVRRAASAFMLLAPTAVVQAAEIIDCTPGQCVNVSESQRHLGGASLKPSESGNELQVRAQARQKGRKRIVVREGKTFVCVLDDGAESCESASVH